MQYKVGTKIFSVKEVSSEYRKKVGLSRTKSLPKGKGLILNYDKPVNYKISMINMKYPLDIIFILDGKVVTIGHGDAKGKDVISSVDFDKVLEIGAGEADGITLSDACDYIGEKMPDNKIDYVKPKEKDPAEAEVIILDDKGKVQGYAEGDERIFSRKNTVKMYELAKLANESGLDTDYKKLGNAIMKYIKIQDTREKQYVR